MIPLTSEMPRNLIGGGKLDESQTNQGKDRSLVTRVLNLTGKDKILATYADEKRPDAKPRSIGGSPVSATGAALPATNGSTKTAAAASPTTKPAMTKGTATTKGTNGTTKSATTGTPSPADTAAAPVQPEKPKIPTVTAQARLISNGVLAVVDRDYDKPITKLHVGEKLYLMVTDADQDASDERDHVTVDISTEFGEQETVKLEETLAHSGVFTGSLQLKSTRNRLPAT